MYIFFIIKLLVHIYNFKDVRYGWQNGWAEWADIFFGNQWFEKKFLILNFFLSKLGNLFFQIKKIYGTEASSKIKL